MARGHPTRVDHDRRLVLLDAIVDEPAEDGERGWGMWHVGGGQGSGLRAGS
jgi:hypothetical protein